MKLDLHKGHIHIVFAFAKAKFAVQSPFIFNSLTARFTIWVYDFLAFWELLALWGPNMCDEKQDFDDFYSLFGFMSTVAFFAAISAEISFT